MAVNLMMQLTKVVALITMSMLMGVAMVALANNFKPLCSPSIRTSTSIRTIAISYITTASNICGHKKSISPGSSKVGGPTASLEPCASACWEASALSLAVF